MSLINSLENYFLKQPEPHQSCMLFLRQWLLEHRLEEQFKYGVPFYSYKNKNLCYMSVSAKEKKLYLGFIQGHKMKHPRLEKEGRKQIKVFYIDPEKDVPVTTLKQILKKAKALY
jgi:hypothetical protein